MSQKIKSLIYLACFVASAIVYYTTSGSDTIENTNTIELAETDFEDVITD